MTSVKRLLKAFLLPKRRARYIGKMMPEVVKQRPQDLLAGCRALGVTTIETTYLGTYPIALDTNGGAVARNVLHHGHNQYDLFRSSAADGLDRSHLFVNVGANIGTTCLNAVEAGFRDIVAFEPVARNFALLERNLASVASRADIALHHHAIGAVEGTATINIHRSSGGRHSFVRDHGHGTEDVLVRRLDDILPDRPGILWVDTEGFELDVLEGARDYLRKNASAICVEITPAALGENRLATLSNLLKEHFGRFVDKNGTSYDDPSIVPALREGRQTDILCLDPRAAQPLPL